MSSSPQSTFIYVTYIRTTQDKLWSALTSPEFSEQYWLGCRADSEWKLGAPWKLTFSDGRVADEGEIAEFEPKRRLAIRWNHRLMPEIAAEGPSYCVMEIEADGEAMKLTVTHTIERADSKFIGAVSGGWPKILSNLKSLLETGEVAVARKVG